MQLTKFGHSCVRIDDGDRSLVLDPGGWSDTAAALDGTDAVLITHEHADHVDGERLRAALRADSRLQVWAPASVTRGLAEFGDQVSTVARDEEFTAAGFGVRTFGGQHALIHPLVPMVANIGYLVDGAVYHPGDSHVVPPTQVDVLLLPSVAPWSTLHQTVDFACAVRAPRAFPIHDGFVRPDRFGGIVHRVLVPITERFGVRYQDWDGSVTV